MGLHEGAFSVMIILVGQDDVWKQWNDDLSSTEPSASFGHALLGSRARLGDDVRLVLDLTVQED